MVTVPLQNEFGQFRPLVDIEADAIRAAVNHYRDVSKAARRLGIGRSTLYRKAGLMGIELRRYVRNGEV